MTDIFEARVGAWLDGRKPPNGLTDEQRANLRADIIDVVRKKAPDRDVDAWLGQVLERVILAQKSGVWPGPQVWAYAIGGIAKKDAAPQSTEMSMAQRSFEVFVKRINAGDPVGERELFSEKVAGRALREQRVSLDDVRRYQRACFFRNRDAYGEEAAFKWLDELAPKLAALLREERDQARQREPDIRPQHAADAEAF